MIMERRQLALKLRGQFVNVSLGDIDELYRFYGYDFQKSLDSREQMQIEVAVEGLSMLRTDEDIH
jgi:hypothetical protein